MMYENDDGRVSFHPDGWLDGELTVSRLYVKPDRRGRHAGYKLLDHVKAYALEHGFKAVNLVCWPFEACGQLENIAMTRRLIKYYRAYGFKSMPCEKARMKLNLKQ